MSLASRADAAKLRLTTAEKDPNLWVSLVFGESRQQQPMRTLLLSKRRKTGCTKRPQSRYHDRA
jgi:hypothetical protein